MRSASAERVVQILDFLTTHPGQGFTLSELSRQLQISKSTLHPLLTSLTDRALLMRNAATREYRPGWALVPMGAVAERSAPVLAHAKAAAERLAQTFEAECVVVAALGEEILVVGRVGIPGPLSISWLEGQRHPWIPPLGTVLLAWQNDAAVEAWLDRLSDELTDAERDRHREVVASVRRRGYAVGLQVTPLYQFEQLYARGNPHTPQGRQEISRALAALAHDDEYIAVADELPPDARVGFVTAPVFGADRTMLLAIALMAGDQYRARDVPRLSHAVVRAAGQVTAAIDGCQPGIDQWPAEGTLRRP